VKTDKRDAPPPAEACKLGAYWPAHRTSDEQRHVRALLTVRDSLVRTRARWVTLAQAIVSREGFRVATGSSGCFAERAERLELPEPLTAEIAPLLTLLAPLNEQIGIMDEKLGDLSHKDERVKRLMTMPEIGPVTAAAYVATLDEAGRFRGAHQVEAYLGLVPREWSSSETQRRGRITKAGNSRMRWLLVEAAWRLATHKKRPETKALREWAERIARRRGQRVAMVALARKLSGILYAMLRDGSVYDPAKLKGALRSKAEQVA
jgi:transposase